MSYTHLNADSGPTLNPELLEKAQARFPLVFRQKRVSEISEQNLHILHRSQAVIDESTRQRSTNQESTVASALNAVHSTYLQQPLAQEAKMLHAVSSGP